MATEVPRVRFPVGTRSQGAFVRQEYTIRDRITVDGSSGFRAEPGRYLSWLKSPSGRGTMHCAGGMMKARRARRTVGTDSVTDR